MNCIRLGDEAPNFEAETTMGSIDFHSWLGESWGILFSHPADFTPVCTTELGALARYRKQFEARNVKVLALSVDSLNDHSAWIDDINETQNVQVNFPIIADEHREIATLYGMIHPNADENATVRYVYVIDPDKKVKLMIVYPAATGRNFDELIRVVDSLQLTAYHKLATPANWQEGQDCVIVPSVTNEAITELFPKGHREVKPYLRYTPDPR